MVYMAKYIIGLKVLHWDNLSLGHKAIGTKWFYLFYVFRVFIDGIWKGY